MWSNKSAFHNIRPQQRTWAKRHGGTTSLLDFDYRNNSSQRSCRWRLHFGNYLQWAFWSLEAIFLNLVILAGSVICCCVQPRQKAQVVSSIRKHVPNSLTLAIGDGENDIAMIQEARVGIGITDKEGFQAARSLEYSIAQFRFLQKLLLVHGRWNYVRTCKYALGTLWKEMVFLLTQALFQRWNGFTGTSLYEPWSLTTFNTLFTSLFVMIIGIFEKDLEASTLLAVLELYRTMA